MPLTQISSVQIQHENIWKVKNKKKHWKIGNSSLTELKGQRNEQKDRWRVKRGSTHIVTVSTATKASYHFPALDFQTTAASLYHQFKVE